MATAGPPLAACQYGVFSLFGTVWFVWLGLQMWRYICLLRTKGTFDGIRHMSSMTSSGGGKVHIGPLDMSLSSIATLSGECAQFCGILYFAWLCENYPLHPPGERVWDRDVFYCLMIVYAIGCLATIKEGKATEILNRDQTEEWKGWMQYVFLMYHYYAAGETYNAIRVFITCYVWMTGFGNFSFFYMKRDFGVPRLLQMMWRLNLLVFFLMLVMNNNYITYYICPLHTFYFMLTYVTMYCFQGLNHSNWGIRLKLLAVLVLIYLVWDAFDGALFNLLWSPFLSKEAVRGGKGGTLWEWYFRTSLDKYSAIWGMLFALNFPAVSQILAKTEELPAGKQWAIKGFALVTWGAICAWWFSGPFLEGKNTYNLGNAYYAPIPMIFYVLARNMHAGSRKYYCNLPHFLGKLTLESYLMQYHVWLSSNATQLLTIIPGHPLVNALLATGLFVVISHRLNYLTLSLRGQLMPDDATSCIRNTVGMAGVLAFYRAIGSVLVSSGLGSSGIFMVSASFGAVVLVYIFFSPDVVRPLSELAKDSDREDGVNEINGGAGKHKTKEQRKMLFMALGAVTLVLLFASAVPKVPPPPPRCALRVGNGKWMSDKGGGRDCNKFPSAGCAANWWEWDHGDSSICGFKKLKAPNAKAALGAHKIIFVGDNTAMAIYSAVERALGTKGAAKGALRIVGTSSDVSGQGIEFRSAQTLQDAAKIVQSSLGSAEMVVFSAGYKDMGDLAGAASGAAALSAAVKKASSQRGLFVSVNSSVVVDSVAAALLPTPATEANMEKVRAALRLELPEPDLTLDAYTLTRPIPEKSTDGVMYSDEVYDVLAQQLLHATKDFYPPAPVDPAHMPGGGRVPLGEMSRPLLGGALIITFAIGLVTYDSYLGLFHGPYLAITGRQVTYDEAYGSLVAKILRIPRSKETVGGTAMEEASGGAYEPVPTVVTRSQAQQAAAAAAVLHGGGNDGAKDGNHR